MLHAKNRTLVTTLATLSLMGMPIVAYADPAGGETPRSDAETASPAPEASQAQGEDRAAPTLVSIGDIQTPGDGDDSHLINQTVETKGVVTAAYPKAENANLKGLEGFTIQTPEQAGPGMLREAPLMASSFLWGSPLHQCLPSVTVLSSKARLMNMRV